MFDLPFLNREAVVSTLVASAPRVLAALAVLLVFWGLVRLTRPSLRRMLTTAGFQPALIRLLVDNLYTATLLIVGLIMAASQLGLNVGAALAGLGVAGIAVGFAAQETVANMIAGFLIFWDRPFKVGDFLTTQDRYGEVTEITMRTTRLRTLDHTYVVIPNRQIIGDMLVNHSMYGKTRVNVAIGIAYRERVAEAREVLLAAARGVEGVAADPPPTVVTTGLGASSVDLAVRVWVEDAAQEMPVMQRVLEAGKAALDEAEIEIPFPHLQVFLDDVKPPVWDRASAWRAAAGGAGSR